MCVCVCVRVCVCVCVCVCRCAELALDADPLVRCVTCAADIDRPWTWLTTDTKLSLAKATAYTARAREHPLHHRRGRPPLGHLGHLALHALRGITAAAGTAAESVAADTGHRPAHATCRQGRRGPDGGVAEAVGVDGREEGLTPAAPVRCRTPVGVPARPARWSCDPQRLCTAAAPSMVHSAPAVATAMIAPHTRARPVSGTRVLRSLRSCFASCGACNLT